LGEDAQVAVSDPFHIGSVTKANGGDSADNLPGNVLDTLTRRIAEL